jgi:hypothetical protein
VDVDGKRTDRQILDLAALQGLEDPHRIERAAVT